MKLFKIISLGLLFLSIVSLAGCISVNNTNNNNIYNEGNLADNSGIASTGDIDNNPVDSNSSTTDAPIDPQPAPDFTVYDADGKAYKLSDMKGKPVVLNFWASWCPPCKAEMPDFDEICKEYEGRVTFMMVNLTDGKNETVESARNFIHMMEYSFPVYYDTDMDAANKYGIQSIPTTFFIDAEGRLIAYYTGAMSGETLKKGISLIYTEVSDK